VKRAENTFDWDQPPEFESNLKESYTFEVKNKTQGALDFEIKLPAI